MTEPCIMTELSFIWWLKWLKINRHIKQPDRFFTREEVQDMLNYI